MNTLSKVHSLHRSLRLVLTALLAVVAWNGARADMVMLPVEVSNYLYVDDLEFRPGVTADVPVYLRNMQAVVSAQFDIRLPYAIPSSGTARLSGRSVGHSASFTPISGQTNAYRVVVTTFENNYLRGNSGVLLYLPMQIPSTAGGNSAKVALSNVVLTDRRGNNIATRTSDEGSLTVDPGERPDLTVRGVTVSPSQTGPGRELVINYTVANIGSGATRSGWTEKFYLQGPSGVRLFLGQRYHSAILAKDATVGDTYTVTLPQVLHVDGDCYGVVEVVPTSATGELVSDRGNNTGVSVGFTTVSKTLTLVTNKGTIYEGQRYGYATLTLTRSGDWSRAETFTISADVQNLVTCNGLTLPAQVTIPAFSAGTSLRIAAVDDRIVRPRQVKITITNTVGYNEVSTTLARVDNDRDPLTLTLLPASLTEGQTLNITAMRGGELAEALDLRVSCSAAARFDKAFNFHFDAGQSTSTLEVKALDNGIVEFDQSVRFTASATDYSTATATLQLLDDDRPAIALTLSQPTVTENFDADEDGLPLVATITRDRGLDREATVWLSSTRSEVSFEQSRVTFAAGESSVSVPVHVSDNASVDGTRSATLTAALYVASAGRTATSGDRACATSELTIVDDEQPYLTLSARVSAVAEGGSATITVRRVQADVSAPLSVSVTSDDPRVTFQPTPVTIPANSRTATTTLRVARNSTVGDNADIVVRATAVNLGPASLRLSVTDRTLPDAVCAKVECIGPRYYSGLPSTFRATVRNYGTGVLPAGMKVRFYCRYRYRYYYYSYYRYTTYYKTYFICEGTTDRDIAAGDEAAFEFEALLPDVVGNYEVWAVVNDDRAITELDYGNNSSRYAYINILAPFQVSEVSVRPEDVLAGQAVTVSGRMTAVEDGLLNGQTVRISLRGDGQSSTTDTRIDPQGNFTANVRTDRSAHGYLTVNALAVGQTASAKTTRLHVYNQSLYCSDGSRWVVNEGQEHQGYFTWVNLSAKPINVASFTVGSLPPGVTIRLTQPSGAIAAGQSVRIPYTVTATRPSSEWSRITFTATSTEDLVSTCTADFRCQATTSHLVFSPVRISTTMLYGRNRTYAVTVKNIGLKATGDLSALAQDSWVLHDADRLTSLDPGASATIHFTFVASESKHTGRTYSSYFQLKPAEGPAAGLPISITVTGHEYSTFAIRASDVYALAQADYSHVAGATVTVKNTRTGRIVHSGTVNAQGIWQTTQMEEGTYDVTVAAARHLTTTRRIAVGPGEDRQVTVFMPYRALVGHFVARYDDELDDYVMDQTFDIDYAAPQAIVQATLADRGFGCGRDTVDIELRNVGRRTALMPRLIFPYVNGCSFTLLNDFPSSLEPGEKFICQVLYEGPESGSMRHISSLRMYYEFDIDGERLYEEDYYRTYVGCGKNGGAPVVDPKPGDDCYGDDCDHPVPPVCKTCGGDPDDPDGPVDPDPIPVPPLYDEPWQPLPSYGCYFMLELDADSVYVGEQLGATLHVRNGLPGALRSMRFLPSESRMDTWEDATPAFTHDEGAATGFTADGSFRQLAGDSEGTLRVLLTPLAEAAPDGSRQYILGGQLQYIDPQTNMHMTASLYGYIITVLPSTGEVELTYLIGRHFIADEAATETVEPTTPGAFALLARGKDDTSFRSLSVSAELPTVVNNAGGAATGLSAQWASVDGKTGAYSFEDFGFEAAEPVRQLAARWIYTTPVSAHTVSIADVATTVTVPGGAAAGTKLTVNAPRELVRPVSTVTYSAFARIDFSADTESDARVKAMSLGDAYLLNDIDDELGVPDVVLTDDGEESDLQDVSAAATITANGTTGEGILHVTAPKAGWIYLRIADPTGGLMRLTRVTRRSDNAFLSPANFWQSELTPQADYTMQQENLMFLADRIASTEEDYLIHFDERPGAPVQLLGVRLFTADGTEVADSATITTPVTRIEVELTGAIRNLTLNNVALTAPDKPEDLGDCPLTSTTDKRRWTLDVSSLKPKKGEYGLNVKAYKFRTDDGREVVGSAKRTWFLNPAGEAQVTVAVAPNEYYGTVTPASGTFAFGEHTFTAEPSKGFIFERWLDAETSAQLSTSETLTLDVTRDRFITAQFAPDYCDVTITAEHGRLLGHTSGVFAYDRELQLAVQPEDGWVFSHWTRNGDRLSDDALTTDHVKGNWTYAAIFVAYDRDGISGLQATDAPVDIYTVTGLRLRSAVTDPRAALRSLPAGIYIVGGRKVLKR